MKFIIPVVSVAVLSLFLTFYKSGFQKQKSEPIVINAQPIDSIISFNISAVGDLMCHSTQYNYARVSADSFNFVPCFEYIQSYLSATDFLIGNLETTLGGTEIPYSGFPFFNSPDDYAESVKKIGFDFVVTANNHANDTGEKGILRTISVLDKISLAHTGSYTSGKDRDSIRLVNLNGVKIGIIAYTYSTNDLPLTEGKPWLVNYCDSALIKKDMAAGRKAGADLMLVFYHFGNEYQRMPSPYQKDFVNYAIDCGADLIIGSHPHVLQPAEFYKAHNARLDTGFVAYSLGNFISNQQDEYTDESVILNINIKKNTNTGKIRISSVEYVPTWVYKGKNDAKKLHLVMPANMVNDTINPLPDFLTAPYQEEMKTAIQHTTATMSKLSPNILPVKTY